MGTLKNDDFIHMRELGEVIPGGNLKNLKIFYSDSCLPEYFSAPNRRAFYKIMLVDGGTGTLSIGCNTYFVKNPVLLFVHPNEIISWKNCSGRPGAYYALFKKEFVSVHPQFKAMLDKFGLFQDRSRSLLELTADTVIVLRRYFNKMETEQGQNDRYQEDTIQALMQLMIVESMKTPHFPAPDAISRERVYIYQFFDLLEQEAAGIRINKPIRIRTVKEFACDLRVHPNYLNAMVKRHTGQNVSVHIRQRLLEESKSLLVQTHWSLQHISYCIGFADQPNFNCFFKQNTGLTPAGFRKSHQP